MIFLIRLAAALLLVLAQAAPAAVRSLEALAAALERSACSGPPAESLLSAFEAAALDADASAHAAAHARLHAVAGRVGAGCEPLLRRAFAALRRGQDRRAAALPPGEQKADSFGHAMRWNPDFDFLPGDVFLMRGGTMISAAVAQIGEQPGFFSHAAIVAADPQWGSLEVVESVVGEGLKLVPLDDWMNTTFARAAVLRHRDRAVAERAAVAAYGEALRRRGKALDYDFSLALDDGAQLYCTELVRRAYRSADPVAAPVPLRLSSVGALAETFPLSALGVAQRQVFLPDDLELDPRFDVALEIRLPAVVAATEPMDRVFRQLYGELRGEARAQTLEAIDRRASPATAALMRLFGHQSAAYERLPDDAKLRLTGLARLAAERLRQESAVASRTP